MGFWTNEGGLPKWSTNTTRFSPRVIGFFLASGVRNAAGFTMQLARNLFPASAQWQQAGLRIVREIGARLGVAQRPAASVRIQREKQASFSSIVRNRAASAFERSRIATLGARGRVAAAGVIRNEAYSVDDVPDAFTDESGDNFLIIC